MNNINKLKRSREPTEIELIRKDLIELMKTLNVYNDSFDLTIDYLARLIVEHKKAQNQFERMGGNVVIPYTNKSGATNLVKNPLYQAIEGMRKDILSYLKELGLTPVGLKKIRADVFDDKDTSDSPLTEILRKLV